jgi:4-diphosphocytidyl-2-C-methyl-D-erythritol kinase
VRVQAFAKINLSLRVLGTRADGYHELRTIFQSIALHDTLTIRRLRGGALRVTCNDPRVPIDRVNLVWRAAEAAWKAGGHRGAPRGVHIDLAKRIPLEAGLGGGSSDAAATLRALARLWRVDPARVPRIAADLGADVPYFLEGGTALGLERGDVVYPLVDYPHAWVVLVLPPFGVSTANAYAWFDQDRRGLASSRKKGSPFSGPLAKKGYGPFFNDLEACVARRHSEIARIVSALRRAGASHAAMSGSGSAVFGLFDSRAVAVRARAALATPARGALVTRTLTRSEYRRLAAK